MCGIAGAWSKNCDKERLKNGVEQMNRVQARRGPDDAGIFVDEINSVVLGHRRLSIIDVSSDGHQPMKFDIRSSKFDGHQTSTISHQTFWITFNGEIYNFQELKTELKKKGYTFRTKTDTEVILALYAEYKEKSFGMLRGMFAFALWNAAEKKLFLVKDRYGIKPLYYYTTNKTLVFASQVKGLMASGLVPQENNPKAWIGFLLFGSVPLPMTTIKNVQAVPPGQYLVCDTEGNQKLVHYYEPMDFFTTGTSDVKNSIKNIRSLLEESIRFHMISDAPIGVFLSGGVDSSIIALLAAQSRTTPITTVGVDFEEKEFSEKKYRSIVVQKIKSDHHEITVTKKDFEESLDQIFEAMDQPTVDGVNTFFVSWAAKKAGLTVVLSGLGSDEIFCGYPLFKKAKFLRKLQSILGHHKSLGLMLSPLLDLCGARYRKLSYFLNDDILSFYLGIRGLFTPQETAKILDINEYEVKNHIKELNNSLLLSHLSSPNLLSPVDLLSFLELKFYLQNQLLKDTDCISLYHSIEVRVPFLDHTLVEYVSSLPSIVKLAIKKSGFQKLNKPLLIASMQNELPPEIYNRPKMGFTFPLQKWLAQYPLIKTHWSRQWAINLFKKYQRL